MHQKPVYQTTLAILATALILNLALFVSTSNASKREKTDRDKNGTTGYPQKDKDSQTSLVKKFTSLFSLDAERGGFSERSLIALLPMW